MDFSSFEGMLFLVEIVLLLVELCILTIVWMHLRKMKIESELLRENIRDLHTVHLELHESISLLKEDIRDLKLNNAELHEFMKTHHAHLTNHVESLRIKK